MVVAIFRPFRWLAKHNKRWWKWSKCNEFAGVSSMAHSALVRPFVPTHSFSLQRRDDDSDGDDDDGDDDDDCDDDDGTWFRLYKVYCHIRTHGHEGCAHARKHHSQAQIQMNAYFVFSNGGPNNIIVINGKMHKHIASTHISKHIQWWWCLCVLTRPKIRTITHTRSLAHSFSLSPYKLSMSISISI